MARPDNDNKGFRKLNMVGKKSFSVSLPIDIVKQLAWSKGQILSVRRQSNKIVIEKIEE